MSSFSWDEDAQRVVSTDDSNDDSDSPPSENTSKPLAACETVDDDEVDKTQTVHTFDLSTLFNFPQGKEMVPDQATMTRCYLPLLQPVPPSSP